MVQYGATPLIDRRAFVRAAGAGFAALMASNAASALTCSDAVFAAAYRNSSGAFGVALLSEDGAILHRYRLPARGHDLVRQPNGDNLVAFARRPGTFAAVFDVTQARVPRVFAAPAGRHFYGHGAFSVDGRLLYATENDFDAARGVIGIYDTTDDFVRIGEFDTFGTGPHDMALLPDGRTLVVANGGIETHPDYPRAKLNVPTMAPNLAFIDARTGKLIARHALPQDLHKLSIRHLALDHNSTVWFACQNEGDIAEALPLVGHASSETGHFETIDLPLTATRALRGYIGSIEANAQTGRVAITSPRGGVALEINPGTGAIVRTIRATDVCGAAPIGGRFAYSSGEGVFARWRHPVGFDNHMTRLDQCVRNC